MSYNVKWKVPFVSFAGVNYVVEILDESESETVYELRGASVPFETTEDCSEDVFTARRSQTGYIRIIDSKFDLNGVPFDWHEMLPNNNMSHQVRLVRVNGTSRTIEWVGYMKAETFTTTTFTINGELAFPVVCPLGTLELIPFVYSSNINTEVTILTIAQILHYALASTGIPFENMYVGNNLASHNEFADLNARISLNNFFDAEPELDGNLATWTNSMSLAELVDSLCRFWGWTIYSRGLNVYIVANGERVTEYRLLSFANLNSATIASASSYTPKVLNLAKTNGDKAVEYVSDNNSEDTLNGYRNITIKADVKEITDIINPDLDDLIYNTTDFDNGADPVSYNDEKTPPESYSWSFLFNLQTVGSHQVKIDNTIVQIGATYYNMSAIYTTLTAVAKDDTWGDKTEKTEFNFRHNIFVLNSSLGNTTYNYTTSPSSPYYSPNDPPKTPTRDVIRMSTIDSYCIPPGYMVSVTGSARGDINPYTAMEYNSLWDFVWMRFVFHGLVFGGIGSMCWIPAMNLWYPGGHNDDMTIGHFYDYTPGNYGFSFRAPINNFSKLKTTKRLNQNWEGASGICIAPQNGQPIMGRIEIAILDNPGRNVILDNLKVSVYAPNSMVHPTAKSVQEYTCVANEHFKRDLSVSLDMASGLGNKYGKGQLYDNNGRCLQTLDYINENNNVLPEVHLMNRMQQTYSVKRNRLCVYVRTGKYNDSTSSENARSIDLPTTLYERNWDNSHIQYKVQSVDRDWVNSTTKLTLIETDA